MAPRPQPTRALPKRVAETAPPAAPDDDEEEEVVPSGKNKDGMHTKANGVSLIMGDGSTGYKGVTKHPSGRFIAQVCKGGTAVKLGRFDTAVAAALAYARHIQSPNAPRSQPTRALPKRGVAETAPPAAADEEDEEDEEEDDDEDEVVVPSGKNKDGMFTKANGVSLIMGSGSTGYKGVSKEATGRFIAQVCDHGVTSKLGRFDTAIAAALAYARHIHSLEKPAKGDGEEEEEDKDKDEEDERDDVLGSGRASRSKAAAAGPSSAGRGKKRAAAGGASGSGGMASRNLRAR